MLTFIFKCFLGLGGAWPSLHTYKKHNPAPKDDEDDNIFEVNMNIILFLFCKIYWSTHLYLFR